MSLQPTQAASQSIDVTHADCLRTVSDIGSSTVMNICSGAQTVVPWGSADWLGAGALAGLGLLVVALIGGLMWSVFGDRY